MKHTGIRILGMLLCVALLLSAVACGSRSAQAQPLGADQIEEDVQKYLTRFVDPSATITSLYQSQDNISETQTEVSCQVSYTSDSGDESGMITLLYDFTGSKWTLSNSASRFDAASGAASEAVPETASETAPENSPEAAPEAAPEDSPEAAPTDSSLPSTSGVLAGNAPSDSLADMTFLLDGVVYQMPVKYSDLTDNGWKPSTEKNISVSAKTDLLTNGLEMTKNGNTLEITSVVNPGDEERSIDDCWITTLRVGLYTMEPSCFSIARGINLNSNVSEIESIFGVGENDETLNYTKYLYEVDSEFHTDKGNYTMVIYPGGYNDRVDKQLAIAGGEYSFMEIRIIADWMIRSGLYS